MTDPTNAELAVQIGEVREDIAEHAKVDQQAHNEAAASRTEVLRLLGEQKEETAGLVAIFKSLEGLSKVLSWIGTFVKWAGGIALTLGGLWALFRGNGRG